MWLMALGSRHDVLRCFIILLEQIGEVVITGEIEMAVTFFIAVCYGEKAIPCGPGIAEPGLMIGSMEHWGSNAGNG